MMRINMMAPNNGFGANNLTNKIHFSKTYFTRIKIKLSSQSINISDFRQNYFMMRINMMAPNNGFGANNLTNKIHFSKTYFTRIKIKLSSQSINISDFRQNYFMMKINMMAPNNGFGANNLTNKIHFSKTYFTRIKIKLSSQSINILDFRQNYFMMKINMMAPNNGFGANNLTNKIHFNILVKHILLG